jgi:hypothetical protein
MPNQANAYASVNDGSGRWTCSLAQAYTPSAYTQACQISGGMKYEALSSDYIQGEETDSKDIKVHGEVISFEKFRGSH